VLLVAGCDTVYPLEPTFCDDWCRATLRAGCDEEPENCVRECEQNRVDASCVKLQQSLLECYQRAEDSAFTCVEVGFGNATRVAGGECQSERDALFECEAPGIGACLVTCRNIQANQQAQADGSAEPSSAETMNACPALDVPCESACWNLTLLAGPESAPNFSGTDAGAITPQRGDPLNCILEGLAGCLSSTTPPRPLPSTSIGELIETCSDASER
jgi:hypothetical protein